MQEVVAVSLAAVFTDQSGPFVFIETDRGFERRDVELGISDLRHVELVSGINAGASVALRRPGRADGSLIDKDNGFKCSIQSIRHPPFLLCW